ncbi:ShlB/FhaC/HecB family hemolysin secretion/activation protein [Flavobacterium sp.]|uniref:ShlB/FhaC/HecB family hemolysin secretion/activation protein n=1 Tax=Flavobacterium sp. TaxID=239 RepID=UPI002B4AB60C|nr:ShlB/FhaC/HecB family hemolysin secretion/activation protein [Flavobacterium sp.]HLP65028.1 ShlB/FhaC/HecB family hemolysin secretion/activation protein [Flavobacterium sp.]
MKKLFVLIISLYHLTGFGQNYYLTVTGLKENETKTIDSIGYQQKFTKESLILDEVNQLTEQLQKKGYLECQIISNSKANDSTHHYQFELKKRIDFIHIYIGDKWKLISETKSDTIKMRFHESETYLINISKKIENKGFSISKVQLKNITKKNNSLIAELFIELDTKRVVNNIIINGYDKFPEGFKKNILKKHRNKTFNKESLEKISNDFKSISFVKQTKYPEILFNPDTTKVYVYIEKKKNNYFDGFLGFSNSDKKLILNGYVDLSLNNILNTGDEFSIKWRSDGKDQKNFNLDIELPFVFKSPIGLKLQLNIFKQDSTFQNSKTDINLGYYLNNKSKIYVGYQSTESSDIGNLNSTLLNDFNNYFFTSSFDFKNSKEDLLFPEKSSLNLKIGYGKRESKIDSSNQFSGSINFNYVLDLNKKNSLYVSSHNYFLQSDSYLINELFRFGGIKSIRGFKENSLQGSQANLILTEYRYRFSPNFYMHSIVDYGYYKDNSTESSNNPLGVGIGFGLLNNGGKLNFIYANGIDNKQVVKLSNSIIHISFKSYF